MTAPVKKPDTAIAAALRKSKRDAKPKKRHSRKATKAQLATMKKASAVRHAKRMLQLKLNRFAKAVISEAHERAFINNYTKHELAGIIDRKLFSAGLRPTKAKKPAALKAKKPAKAKAAPKAKKKAVAK